MSFLGTLIILIFLALGIIAGLIFFILGIINKKNYWLYGGIIGFVLSIIFFISVLVIFIKDNTEAIKDFFNKIEEKNEISSYNYEELHFVKNDTIILNKEQMEKIIVEVFSNKNPYTIQIIDIDKGLQPFSNKSSLNIRIKPPTHAYMSSYATLLLTDTNDLKSNNIEFSIDNVKETIDLRYDFTPFDWKQLQRIELYFENLEQK